MTEPSPKACAICGKPQAERFRPFCSARCKDVDLNRWFSGAYAIPAAESAETSRSWSGACRTTGKGAEGPRGPESGLSGQAETEPL